MILCPQQNWEQSKRDTQVFLYILVTRFWLRGTAVFNLVLPCTQMWLTIFHMMQHWCRLLFQTTASICLGLGNSTSLLTLTQLKHQTAAPTPSPSKCSWVLYHQKTQVPASMHEKVILQIIILWSCKKIRPKFLTDTVPHDHRESLIQVDHFWNVLGLEWLL